MPAGTFTAQPDPLIQQVHSVHRPLFYRIEKEAQVASTPVEIVQARVTIEYNGSPLVNSLTGDTIELIVDNIEDLGSDLYAIDFSIAQQLKDQLDPTSLRDLPAIFRNLSTVDSSVESSSFALVSVTVNYYYFQNTAGRLLLTLAAGEDDTSSTCMVANFLEQTLGQTGLAGPNALWANQVQAEYLLINDHVDASGSDIAGRTLTAAQKQYIYDTAINTLWSRFGSASATIVQRTPAEMAASMYCWAVDSTKTVTANQFPFSTVNLGWEYGGSLYQSQGFIENVSGSSYTMCWDITTGTTYFESISDRQRISAGGSLFNGPAPIVKWGSAAGTPTIYLRFNNASLGFSGFTGKFVLGSNVNGLGITDNPNLTEIQEDQITEVAENFVLNNNNLTQANIENVFDKVYDLVVTQGTGATAKTFDVSGNAGAGGFSTSRATEIGIISNPPYDWTVIS